MEKSEDDFPRNRSRPDGRAGICKVCQRAYVKSHYWRNRDSYLKKARIRNRVEIAKMRSLVRKLKDVPCADCGQRYPYWVMEFDHVRGIKLFDISTHLYLGATRILEEIAKCDVVCSNCHATRTYHRLARARSSVE